MPVFLYKNLIEYNDSSRSKRKHRKKFIRREIKLCAEKKFYALRNLAMSRKMRTSQGRLL